MAAKSGKMDSTEALNQAFSQFFPPQIPQVNKLAYWGMNLLHPQPLHTHSFSGSQLINAIVGAQEMTRDLSGLSYN